MACRDLDSFEMDEDLPSSLRSRLGSTFGMEQDGMSIESHVENSSACTFDTDVGVDDGMNDSNTPSSFSGNKPFDLEKLRRSIEQGEAVLSQIEGKDVVVVVGKTGTGKSTLIQGIAGKVFHQTIHKCEVYNEHAETKVFEATDPIPGFEIGHSKSSMTKSINCFFQRHGSSIVYIDTPGFEDTDGPEVDIATSIMLSQIARKCGSIRFVVMVNYVSLLEDRGGAFRSVLKFVRKFVDGSFKDERQSFVFLFSHTNAIKFCPEDIVTARQHLLNEVRNTIDGTKDNEVLDVLNFVRQSLEKAFPFVDVVIPLKTDFARLASSIEGKKIKPLKNKKIPPFCGLSTASKMKLEALMCRLAGEMRSMFRGDALDSSKVEYVTKMFEYFTKYLNFGDVAKRIKEFNEVIKHHVQDLESKVELEIKRGTTMTNDQDFSEANVVQLKGALIQLVTFSNQTSLGDIEGNIFNMVLAFQKRLLEQQYEAFEGITWKLSKLHAWCKMDHPNMTFLYLQVIQHINGLIAELVRSINAFELESLPLVDENQLRDFFYKLLLLKSMDDYAKCLSSHNLNWKVAQQTTTNLASKLEATVESWKADVQNLIGNALFQKKAAVESIKQRSGTLETISRLLNGDGRYQELNSIVHDVKNSIVGDVTDCYALSCDSLKQSWNSSPKSTQTDMILLRHSALVFTSLNDKGWKKMNVEFSSLKSTISSALRFKFTAFDERVALSFSNGLQDAQRDAKSLLFFEEFLWFDKLLEPEKQFVQANVAAIRTRYNERGEKVLSDVRKTLSTLSEDKNGVNIMDTSSSDALSQIKPMLHEVPALKSIGFAIVSPELSSLQRNVNAALCAYIGRRLSVWMRINSQWKQSTGEMQADVDEMQVHCLNQTISRCLSEIKVLSGLELENDSLEDVMKMDSEIRNCLMSFTEKVKRQIETNSDYEVVRKLLSFVKALKHCSQTEKLLPRYDDLIQQTRSRISSLMEKIDRRAKENSELDELKKDAAELEQALILDGFVEQDMSSRLRQLKFMIAKKSELVDDSFVLMLTSQDFIGLKEYLQSLSKNRQKQQKYNRCLAKVRELVESEATTLIHYLESPLSEQNISQVVRGFKFLDDAKSNVGTLMVGRYDFDSVFAVAKRKVDNKIKNQLEQMELAHSKQDLVEMNQCNNLITICADQLEDYFSPEVKKRRDDCQDNYKMLLKSVPSRIDKLVDSHFEQEMDVLTILSSLKSSRESNRPELESLALQYDKAKMTLTSTIGKALDLQRKLVEEAGCYDDPIKYLQSLLRAIDNGLNEHVDSKLVNDWKSLLGAWRENRRKQELEMEFEGSDAIEKLDKWALRLNQLDPSGGFLNRCMNRMMGRKKTEGAYKKLKHTLEKSARKWFRRGEEALAANDYTRLQECFETLELMGQKLGKHIHVAKTKPANLKSKTSDHVLALCEKCIALLKAKEFLEFQRLFADYRACLLELSFLKDETPSLKDARKNIHQLLVVWMEEEVISLSKLKEGLDFRAFRKKIGHLRTFGGFVADNFRS